MTESSKTASASGQSVLLPQGDHAGKPGLPLGSRPFTLIGSRNRAHLHLLSTTISRSHACIISSKSGMYVRDLASRTGVHVNGRKVKEMDLQDGDMLEVGSFKFRLQEPLGAIHLATTPRPPLAMLEGAGGKPTPLDERSVLIGRRPTCEILLDSATVSSTHAIIFECDGQRYIRDLGSRTGTHINGEPVHQQILRSGDQIRIGDTSFRYVSSDAPVDELEEDSDTAVLGVDLIEEDELAPMPIPLGHEQDELARATDVDDLAPLHAHSERPADPIAAARMEHDAIPLASHDELQTSAEDLHAEQSAAPVEAEPAPAANGEFVVADDAAEAEWLPIDFTEVDQPVTDLAAPIAEQGLTAPGDVLEEAEPGLDSWGSATATPIDRVTSEAAHEIPAPIELETAPEEAKTIAVPEAEPLPIDDEPVSDAAKEEPADVEPPSDLDLLDLEDVPGEYLPSAIAQTEEPVSEVSAPISLASEPIRTDPQPGFSHSETSLAPSLEDLEEAGGEFDFLSEAAPVAPPHEIDDVAVLDDAAHIEESEPIVAPEPVAVEEIVAADTQSPAPVEEEPAPLAELVVEPAQVPTPAISPPTAAPEAIAAAEPVTAVELESEIEAPALPEQPDEIVVPALEVTPPAETRDEALQTSEPAAPLSVEAVDLSAVTFEAPSPTPETTEALAEPLPEASSAPQPLLDLTPVPPEEIALESLSAPAEVAIDEGVDGATDESASTTAEPATSEKKERKPRAPRKKPTTPRGASRRKKGDQVQTAIAAANESQDLAPVAEAMVVEAATAAVGPELVAQSADVDQPKITEPAEAVSQPADVETILQSADATNLSSKAAEVLSAQVDHESSEVVSDGEVPVAEPLFKLANADLVRVEAAQVAAEAEPVESKSEPIIAQAPAEELATDAFYSGPADETPLVSVDTHEQPSAAEPAVVGLTDQATEDEEPEILAFEAAATTPEAKEVMAAWHETESDPTVYDPKFRTLPAPTELTSDLHAVEPNMVEPSASESTSSVTAWVHEDVVPLETSSAEPIETSPASHSIPVTDEISLSAVGVETIEKTEPTVESALDLGPSLAQVSETSGTADLVEVDATLTDTAFGRAVNDFTGSGLGPLVEETLPSPHPAISVPDPTETFDHFLEDQPEFVMPAASNGEQADFLDASFFESEVFEAKIDSSDVTAANLSADLPGEVATPPQTLTLGELPHEPATVDATVHAADVTLTTAHDIESPQTANDDDFIAIGEDALIEPLEFDEQIADKLPAIDLFADSENEAQTEPIVDEQPLAAIAREELAPTLAPGLDETPATTSPPVVAEATVPVVAEVQTPPPTVAETPAPAPAAQPVKPPPLNPYFGMERDSGSFLGGMPLSFTAPLRESPRGPAARQQDDRLPPPRLAPASAPETDSAPRSPFPLISPVAPIQGFAPAPAFDPFQPPAARLAPAPTQPQEPVDKKLVEEPIPAAEAPVIEIEDEFEPELVADHAVVAPEAEAEPAAIEDPDDILFQAEEPIELFDGAADQLDDLPDALDAIDDFEGALAGPEPTEVPEPAKGKLVETAPTAAVEPAKTETAPVAVAATHTSTAAVTPATPPPAAVPPKPSAPSVFAAFSSMTSVAPPLQSLTGSAGPAKPAAPAAPITVPPFAGSRPNARGVANPFAGMATPPPRLNTTDIFSQTTFPAPNEAMFQPQPIDIPPVKVRTPGVDPSATPKRPEPRREPDSRPGQHAAPPPQGQAAEQLSHKPAASTPAKKENPPKKKWWQSIRLLLPLMLLIMSAAVVAIVRLFPPRTLVQGTLQIKGLDELNPLQRKDEIRAVRELLTKPDLQNTVVGRLATQGISPGFTQDPIALGTLADPENSPLDRNLLVLKRISTDPGDDQKRMHALLLAVYSEAKTPTDGVRAAGDVQVKAAQDKVAALQSEYDAGQLALQKLTDQLRAATGSSAREVLQNPTAAIATLQRQHEQLGTALADANAKVKTARDILNRTQDATAALPGTVADPQLAGMQQNINSLHARLTSARVARGPALESATQAFDESLQSLKQELLVVAMSPGDNAASAYAGNALQASKEMRELLSRQKQERDDIGLLNGQFADRREAYLMQVWAGDETLKELLGERDAQAGRNRIAVNGGNADEIAAAHTAITGLDQRIDARRRELATGGQFSDNVSQKLQQAIDRLNIDRQENERRMASDLALLDVPPAKNLPASEQSSMASIGERVAAVQAARDQYVAACNAAKTQHSGGEARVIEEEIAEQQVRIDAYQQQVQIDPPMLAKARQALDSAQNAEAKAQLAYADNLDLLASARELTDAKARVDQSRAAVATARNDLETQRSQAGNLVQLESPDETSSQVIYEPDQRHWYMIAALGGLALLFAGPIWMGLRESHSPAPFAMIINESEGADTDLEEFHEINAIEDEGHAAAV